MSSRQFGLKLKEVFLPGDVVVNLGDYETANSVNFYAPTPLYVYDGSAALLEWGLRYPDAPSRVLNRGDLEQKWNGNGRVFLLCVDARLAGLGLAHVFPVMESAGRTLICNQPCSRGR
jgi:hypothetical protein